MKDEHMSNEPLEKKGRKGHIHNLKFLGKVAMKVGSENLIFTGQIKSKSDKRKQCIAYLENLCKWKSKQGLWQIKAKSINSYVVPEIVDSHDRQRPEGAHQIEKNIFTQQK